MERKLKKGKKKKDVVYITYVCLLSILQSEKKSTLTTTKRKAPSRSKPSVFTTSSHGNATPTTSVSNTKKPTLNSEKNRKKPTQEETDDLSKKQSNISIKPVTKKPITPSHSTTAPRPEPSTNAVPNPKKVASVIDQPPKKKKKVETKTDTVDPVPETPVDIKTPQEVTEKKKKTPVDLVSKPQMAVFS